MASAIGLVKRIYAVSTRLPILYCSLRANEKERVHISRISQAFSPSPVPKSTSLKPLKFGILGAAKIAPSALIIPAKTHPEVVVYAVAARSLAKAQAFAKKHGIEKAYEGYQGICSMRFARPISKNLKADMPIKRFWMIQK